MQKKRSEKQWILFESIISTFSSRVVNVLLSFFKWLTSPLAFRNGNPDFIHEKNKVECFLYFKNKATKYAWSDTLIIPVISIRGVQEQRNNWSPIFICILVEAIFDQHKTSKFIINETASKKGSDAPVLIKPNYKLWWCYQEWDHFHFALVVLPCFWNLHKLLFWYSSC